MIIDFALTVAIFVVLIVSLVLTVVFDQLDCVHDQKHYEILTGVGSVLACFFALIGFSLTLRRYISNVDNRGYEPMGFVFITVAVILAGSTVIDFITTDNNDDTCKLQRITSLSIKAITIAAILGYFIYLLVLYIQQKQQAQVSNSFGRYYY